jgi:hypothetical protein
MSTLIKIKRSSTSNVPNLGQGELGYSWGTSTYTDAQSASVTSYGKLFLGTGTETGGLAANIEAIGGKYFTDLLDHGHGTLTANSAVIVDSANKINVWNVDNLRLDGNIISSTNSDGDITISPNGNGEIVIPDNTFLTFGTSKDTKITYDESTDDRLEITGADWNFANGVAIKVTDTTTSTSSTTGALTVTGGVGIAENLHVGGTATVNTLSVLNTFSVSDLTVTADLTVQGGDITVSNSATNVNIRDNTSNSFSIREGNNRYLNIITTDNSELIQFSTGNVDIDNNLNVDGGSLTTGSNSFNLLNTTATTINAFGAATTVNLGTSSTTVDFGDLRIRGATISGDANGQTIVIDPFPAGGASGGDVVVRGNLKISGTTTTVNSNSITINDPTITLGDSVSDKVLVSDASNGATTLTLDNTTGLNTGDLISGNSNIVNGTTITVNSATQITLSSAITGAISSGTEFTFTQATDDNMDRGIEFKYYNQSLKTGFFGYDESGESEDVTTYYFTYIPDATNNSSVFTGTKGSAYFKTVKLDDGVNKGIPFFDSYKRLTSTAAANMASPGTGSDATTSYQLLTVNSSGVPVWTTAIDGGSY